MHHLLHHNRIPAQAEKVRKATSVSFWEHRQIPICPFRFNSHKPKSGSWFVRHSEVGLESGLHEVLGSKHGNHDTSMHLF